MAVGPLFTAKSVELICLPVALITVPRNFNHSPISTEFIVFPLSIVNCEFIGESAFPVALVIFPLAHVFRSVGVVQSSLPVTISEQKLSFINQTLRILVYAIFSSNLSVILMVQPFSLFISIFQYKLLYNNYLFLIIFYF